MNCACLASASIGKAWSALTATWQRSLGLRGLSTRCIPLVWGEDDPIPLDTDIGTRVDPEADDSVRLRRAYLEDVEKLIAIRGSLTYQPIEGLYLAPIDIDLS